MKRLFQLCSLAFLAACAAGCGKKDSTVHAEAPSESPGGVDYDSLMRRGVSCVAQKDAEAAAEAAAKALELNPESAEAHLLAGQAAYQKADFKKARGYFSSVANEPSLPAALRAKAYAGLGVAAYGQSEYDKARISFLHALWLDPKNEAALYHLGKLYEDVYQFMKAASDQFKMFAYLSEQTHPGNPRAKKVKEQILPEISRKIAVQAGDGSGNATRAAVLVQEAWVLREKNQKSAAKKKYEEALKVDPQSYDAARGYAQTVRDTEKTAEGARKAFQAYCRAAALKPGISGNYLAAAYLARDYESELKIQAVEVMNRAVAYHPQDKDVLDQLIAALLKTGQKDLADAWDEYRKALRR